MCELVVLGIVAFWLVQACLTLLHNHAAVLLTYKPFACDLCMSLWGSALVVEVGVLYANIPLTYHLLAVPGIALALARNRKTE